MFFVFIFFINLYGKSRKNRHKKKEKSQTGYPFIQRRERLPNLWFLRISQNTQTVVYQLFVKLTKNQNITKYLSVSQFLGVKLGVDFEFTPKR